MKAHLVRRESNGSVHQAPASLTGMVLAHEARDAQGAIALEKGAIIGPSNVDALMALPWSELHLVEPEPGELYEDDAGLRIANAAAGDGVEVGAFSAGSRPLVATRRGILDIHVDQLRRVNSVDGACIYTLYDGLIAEPGEIVARAKITPFVLAERCVREAERAARDGGDGVMRVRPFVPMTVGAVVKESLGEKAMARFRDALGRKITWFGSRLLEPSFVPPSAGAIADGIESLVRNGAQVIMIAGAKAMDPLDPAFVALGRLGIGLDRFGVPAHPGSLFWMAHVRDVSILGMPTCGLFSKATVFDLVLPRVLAGERITNAALAELGHGGMLTRDMAYRFPQYDPAKSRGALE
ncbi:MAG TPA: hypothetical protein VF166_10545 [Gemmatimonadaceae bacterium]